jgi:hypothetical protein
MATTKVRGLSEQTQLRIAYATEKVIMHKDLNHKLASKGLPKQDNCSQAIKSCYENKIIDSPKKTSCQQINKMGNQAMHNFNDKLQPKQ